MHGRLIPIALALALLGSSPLAQVASGPALAVHHTFPEAGSTLRVVVEGLPPLSSAVVTLENPLEAPPSVRDWFLQTDLYRFLPVDDRGLLSFSIELDDPDDAGRFIGLRFSDLTGELSENLALLVQPPMLWVPTSQGLTRIDLRDGLVLPPAIPGDGGFLGAALSDDGLLGYVLRSGGLLETRSADRWDSAPRTVRQLDAFGDDLARGPGPAPAFVIVRPEGAPFAPSGRLVFLEDGGGEVVLESLAEAVSGRRWAVSHDGLTGFIAEDDLLVREVNLLTRERGTLFSAGVSGDDVIADLVFDSGRLLVLTRRPGGLSGTLTVLDLGTGWLSTFPLRIDPARFVTLDGDRVLVVPMAGPVVEVIRGGVPDVPLVAGGGVLDATAVPGGAVLLEGDAEGSRLTRWSDDGTLLQVADGIPSAARLVSGAGDVVMLLGAKDGVLMRADIGTGQVQIVPDVRVTPGTFAVLP